MTKIAMFFLTAFTFFTCAPPVWAQSYCQAAYGNGICPTCNGIGRTYTKVGGVYCTVCNSFCNISSKQLSDTKSYSVAHSKTDPAFILSTPKNILYSIVQFNPEAAMLLAVLDARSKTVDALPPVRGDGGSDRAMSPLAVLGFIEGESDSAKLHSLTIALPKSATQSKVVWDLERVGESATLKISHRFLNDQDVVVEQPYKDLEVNLRWVSKAGTGYWIAQNWRERP